jgi:hypothetical protein
MDRTTSLTCQAIRTSPGGEESEEPGLATLVEALVGLGEQTPGPVERVVLSAPVAEGLVLDPAAALVELRVRQLHEVERVSDEGGVSEAVLEGLAAGEVEHPVADGVAPRLGAGLEPGAGTGGAAAGHHVEQLGAGPGGDVDDGGAPVLGPAAAPPAEQCLVEAQGAHLPDTGRVLHKGGAVGDDGVVDGVPVAAELPGDLGHGAAQSADLFRHPPPRPVRHRPTRRGHPRVLAGERSRRAALVGTEQSVLVPHQPGRAPEARQVGELHGRAVLDPHGPTARPARQRLLGPGLDVHSDRLAGLVLDAEDAHIRKANKQLADARRVSLHRGSRGSVGVGTSRFSEPLCRAWWTPYRPLTPRSNPKRHNDYYGGK